MKYIKKYNEEVNLKKVLVGGALAATMLTACKKDDIEPIYQDTQSIETDSGKTIDLSKVTDVVDKISKSKEEKSKTEKIQPKKNERIMKFKKFLKSKFKKSK